MEKTFTIQLNNEILEVQPPLLSSNEPIFKIMKEGKPEFAIKPIIDKNDNESWELADTYKSALLNQDIIQAVGDKIDSYYA